MTSPPPGGVVLLNMGGPDSLVDVRPFLFNLFSDRDIITLGPRFLQKFIAWNIARKRAPKAQAVYSRIGGGSPLKKITRLQARALEKALNVDGDYMVDIAMRYWPPYPEEALARFAQAGVKEITVISLYPHYSKATTGSSVKHFKQAVENSRYSFDVTYIESWPAQQSYIEALSGNIQQVLGQFSGQDVELVYSAHNLPVSFVEAGDPYVEQLHLTISAIEKITGKKGRLCYQSKSGPVEWLSPSTADMIDRLAQEGCKNIAMVPISFVSDHVETLYEINMLFKDQAKEVGVELVSTESLGTNPLFIRALQELVLKNQKGET